MPEATFKAERSDGRGFPVHEITVCVDERGCFVNNRKAKMSYNGIQLRFELEGGGHPYITFDETNPGRPIAKIYQELGGKIESPRRSSEKRKR